MSVPGSEVYEATFRENAINEKVLPNLTAEDLKDMGIGIVGHRRMLLDAIAALHIGADAKAPTLSSTPLPTAPVAAASTPEASGERRHVTVMFCDLVEFDRNRCTARRRGMARSGRRLPRRRFSRGH